jgi:hypothetical protein
VPNRTTAVGLRREINICGGCSTRRPTLPSPRKAVTFRSCSDVYYRGWAVSQLWAIAHRLCRLIWKILHEGVRFIERGPEVNPRAKKERAQMLARALRKLGYQVTITPINQVTATNGV